MIFQIIQENILNFRKLLLQTKKIKIINIKIISFYFKTSL